MERMLDFLLIMIEPTYVSDKQIIWNLGTDIYSLMRNILLRFHLHVGKFLLFALLDSRFFSAPLHVNSRVWLYHKKV